jgi:hypothetical protein
MINADDYFADEHVLQEVAEAFEAQGTPVVYGDIDYVDASDKIIRRWRSGKYSHGMFNRGWMPPHPTFYCRRELFDKFGFYSLGYGTAADYELMLRFLHKNRAKAHYLKKVMVKMKTGGASNKNVNNRVKGFLNDFKAMKKNGISIPFFTILLKPARKIWQFL